MTFPTESPFILATPVMLPPGWAKLLMKPEPTGSVAGAMMMGMVDVALWAAAIAGVVTATTTSGLRAISSTPYGSASPKPDLVGLGSDVG